MALEISPLYMAMVSVLMKESSIAIGRHRKLGHIKNMAV